MAQNIGTLVSAAVRPNDSNDPIASAFQSEIKGGLHAYETLAERDAIILERREWGMIVNVYNDPFIDNNAQWELKYNFSAPDLSDNNNWVKIESAPVLFFSKTHSEMIALMSSNGLVPSALYEINDYQTIHRITNTTAINTAPVEPLIVRAVSTSKIDLLAYSAAYPRDIIHYNIDNVLCEDGTTPRPGKILYREDTVNKVSAYYDWRNVKFRRWAINLASYSTWSAATTYAANAAVLDASNNLWISNSDGNLNNTPSTTANSYWTLIWENVATGTNKYFITAGVAISMGLYTLTPNASDFKDYFTFHNITVDAQWVPNGTNLENISIGPSGDASASSVSDGPGYNNIVFLMGTSPSCKYINFRFANVNKTICIDNTNNFFFGNDFGPYTNLMFFRGGGYYLIFKPTTVQNIFGNFINASGGLFVRCVLAGASLFGIQSYNANTQDLRILNGATNNVFSARGLRIVIGINNARNHFVSMTDCRILGSAIMTSCNVGPLELSNSTTSGNYRLITSSVNGGGTIFTARIPLTFNGAAGSGAVGALTLERITVPTGFAVDVITVRCTSVTYGSGAALTFGFTGNTEAALNSISGTLTSANDFFKVRPTTAPSTTATNLIVGGVAGNSITAGSAVVTITFTKIN